MNNDARGAVIFDMDGVILDTERLIEVCWRQAAGILGLDEDTVIEVLDRSTGVTEDNTRRFFAEAFGETVAFDEFKRVVRARKAAICPDGRMPVKPGAAHILGALRSWGVKTALASSTQRAVVEDELRGVDLYDGFDVVVCGDMVSASKPAPDIFLTAARQLGVDPRDCWVVEDSYNGVRAGHAAGMRTIMVPDRMPATEEMRALSEAVVPDLARCEGLLARRFAQENT